MEFECPFCNKDCETEERPFGLDVLCCNCGKHLETDMEEGYDSLSFFVTGKEGEEREPIIKSKPQ